MCTAANAISIDEAAEFLATTAPRILMMLKKQELVGSQDEEGAWMIEKSSLQRCNKPNPADIVEKKCGGGCGGCGGH